MISFQSLKPDNINSAIMQKTKSLIRYLVQEHAINWIEVKSIKLTRYIFLLNLYGCVENNYLLWSLFRMKLVILLINSCLSLKIYHSIPKNEETTKQFPHSRHFWLFVIVGKCQKKFNDLRMHIYTFSFGGRILR